MRLEGMNTLLSIMQMPGAINAALLAADVLALSDPKIAKQLDAWRARQTKAVARHPKD